MSGFEHDGEQLLILLKSTTLQILDLDLEKEEEADRLLLLQEEQKSLRERIEGLMTPKYRSADAVQELLRECYELERQLNVKLILFRNELTDHINKFQEGSRIRGTYNYEYEQAEGYFIDFKK